MMHTWLRSSVCSHQSSALNLSVHQSLAAEGKAELPSSAPALHWVAACKKCNMGSKLFYHRTDI